MIDTKPIAYSEEYDTYYNEETNEWVEDKCDDPTCEFCVNRPDKPLEKNNEGTRTPSLLRRYA